MFRVQKPKLENLTKKHVTMETMSEKRKTEEKSSPDCSINFIHHFSPAKKKKKIQRSKLICLYHTETCDLFFEVFLILSGTKPLTSTMCLYCLYAMDLFRCSPGE